MNEQRPIEGLEELKAPRLSEERRRRLRDRILARAEPLLIRRRRGSSHWEILASWARPGLAAAAVLLALVLAAAQIRGPSAAETSAAPVALEEVLRQTDENDSLPAVLLTASEPDADAVVATVFARSTGPRRFGN